MLTYTYIYGLKDPRDDKFHYVGRTNNPTRRNYEHRAMKTKNAYSDWHVEMMGAGVRPVMVILAKVSGNGAYHELVWLKRLIAEGHPIRNKRQRRTGGSKIGTQTFGPLKSTEEIRAEKAERIKASWRKWYDSLTAKQRSEYQRKKLDNGGKERMIASQKGRKLDPEFVRRRTVLVTKALKTPEARANLAARPGIYDGMNAEQRRAYWRKIHHKD